MLLPVIKEQLSLRLGHEIRYPSDCERLSVDIFSSTHQHIGVTTLKRLFGFVRGCKHPRMSTLDILAQYLGFDTYSQLIVALDPDTPRDTPDGISTLLASSLKSGAIVELAWEGSSLKLECAGGNIFIVKESVNSGLEYADRIACDSFRVGYPLYIRYAIRQDMRQGSKTLAAISGIEQILTS